MEYIIFENFINFKRSNEMVQDIIHFFESFGYIGMFIHSFIDAIFFPIPAFFLQVSLSIMNPSTALWLATVGFIACLLGTPIGYVIGRKLGDAVLYKILKQEWVDKASALFSKNGEAAILIGAFTPIPFKVFTILSGCFKFPLWKLISYAAIGRAVKFYVVGVAFYLYGRASEKFVTSYLSYIMGGIAFLLFIYFYMKSKREKKRKQRAEETTVTENNEQLELAITEENSEVEEVTKQEEHSLAQTKSAVNEQ
jgi:membrane protein YqaA with SNARE-associated domain